MRSTLPGHDFGEELHGLLRIEKVERQTRGVKFCDVFESKSMMLGGVSLDASRATAQNTLGAWSVLGALLVVVSLF